jgi:PAS domain-containing protein
MSHSPLHVEDAWFDLVPLALLEFNEHGRVLRANSALSALLGYAIPPGSALSDTPQALQRLCGWDSPLTLLALGPEDGPLLNQVMQPRPGSVTAHLRAQVCTQVQSNNDSPRRFLCAIKESVVAAPSVAAPASNITSDADAAPLPDQAQLLHELSTILESTPAGIAYFRDNVLVRCNRRFERMLGLTPGTMAGQSMQALLASDPRIDRVVTETATEFTGP